MNLPWAEGFAQSERLARAFAASVAALDGGSGPSNRKPMVNEGIDVVVFLVFTVALLLINWAVRLLVVAPIAKAILHGPTPSNPSPKQKAAFAKKLAVKVDKFSQTAMEQIFYGAFACFGSVMVLTQEWSWPSKNWWLDFDKKDVDGFSIHSHMTEAVAAFYILYAARYFQGMLSVCLEHKRRDFWEMQLHHFVTCALVAISYTYGWNRVGLVIMLVLDPADVPLHTAKMCKYIGERRCPKQPSNAYQLASDGLFVVFMLSFFATRLVMYPYICWSAHIEATQYFEKGVPEWTCVVLLYILLALQVFWGWLILRVLYKLVRDGHVEDNRSDDEEEVEGGGAQSLKKD